MKKLSPLYPLKLIDIKLEHIQRVFDECSYGYGTKNTMKAIVSLYSCRHTFATLCNKTDSNYFVARKRLIEHTDLQTTARYTHSDVEDMRTIINELSID